MNVTIPEGNHGRLSINKLIVDSVGTSVQHHIDGDPEDIPMGTYTFLNHGKECLMSDLPHEHREHVEPIAEATTRGGDCIINGLGIGLVCDGILSGHRSATVTVIEVSEDVIALVEPTLRRKYGDRFNVIHADAFTWVPTPGKRWTVGWHDIGPYLSRDWVAGIDILRAKYESLVDWQGAWLEGRARAIP